MKTRNTPLCLLCSGLLTICLLAVPSCKDSHRNLPASENASEVVDPRKSLEVPRTGSDFPSAQIEDPFDALKSLPAASNGSNRNAALNQIARAAGNNPELDIDKYLDFIDVNLSGSERVLFLRTYLQTIAESAPEEAFGKLARYGPGVDRRQIVNGVIRAWASADPVAAARAMRELPFKEDFKKALSSLAFGLSDKPERALELLAANLGPEVSRLASEEISHESAKDNVALESILAIPQIDREGAVTGILMAGRSKELLEYLVGNSDFPLSKTGQSNLGRALGEKNPLESMQMITSAVGEDMASTGTLSFVGVGTFSRWMESDSDSALNWLTKANAPDGFYDELALRVVEYARRHGERETALRWLESIKSEKPRALGMGMLGIDAEATQPE